MSHQIHTYAELRRQIHDDLRIQHPEWLRPNGESLMCDSYEARSWNYSRLSRQSDPTTLSQRFILSFSRD
jgi:hypothetical protein